MRRSGGVIVLLVISLSLGSHDVRAVPPNCMWTNCNVACEVRGTFGGYCAKQAPQTTGCIQLYGPDCASMENAYCCREWGSAF